MVEERLSPRPDGARANHDRACESHQEVSNRCNPAGLVAWGPASLRKPRRPHDALALLLRGRLQSAPRREAPCRAQSTRRIPRRAHSSWRVFAWPSPGAWHPWPERSGPRGIGIRRSRGVPRERDHKSSTVKSLAGNLATLPKVSKKYCVLLLTASWRPPPYRRRCR